MPPTKDKHLHFIHSPFMFEVDGVKVSCDTNGQITLTKEDPVEADTFDEITCGAGLILTISDMIMKTRKKVWKDEPFREGGSK